VAHHAARHAGRLATAAAAAVPVPPGAREARGAAAGRRGVAAARSRDPTAAGRCVRRAAHGPALGGDRGTPGLVGRARARADGVHAPPRAAVAVAVVPTRRCPAPTPNPAPGARAAGPRDHVVLHSAAVVHPRRTGAGPGAWARVAVPARTRRQRLPQGGHRGRGHPARCGHDHFPVPDSCRRPCPCRAAWHRVAGAAAAAGRGRRYRRRSRSWLPVAEPDSSSRPRSTPPPARPAALQFSHETLVRDRPARLHHASLFSPSKPPQTPTEDLP